MLGDEVFLWAGKKFGALNAQLRELSQAITNVDIDASQVISGTLNVLRLPIIPKDKGGFGQDVSVGLTNSHVAQVVGGQIVIAALSDSPNRVRFYRVVTPATSSTSNIVVAFDASDPNVYAGPIVQPDVPRSLLVNWGGGWTGGPITIDGIFDGQPVQYVLADVPGFVVSYPSSLVTTVTQVQKSAVGVGISTIGCGPVLGIETGGPSLAPFGVGFVDSVSAATDPPSRLDAKDIGFASTPPNGLRTFIYGANVL